MKGSKRKNLSVWLNFTVVLKSVEKPHT